MQRTGPSFFCPPSVRPRPSNFGRTRGPRKNWQFSNLTICRWSVTSSERQVVTSKRAASGVVETHVESNTWCRPRSLHSTQGGGFEADECGDDGDREVSKGDRNWKNFSAPYKCALIDRLPTQVRSFGVRGFFGGCGRRGIAYYRSSHDDSGTLSWSRILDLSFCPLSISDAVILLPRPHRYYDMSMKTLENSSFSLKFSIN